VHRPIAANIGKLPRFIEQISDARHFAPFPLGSLSWRERKGIVMSIAIAVVALAVGIGIVATLIATNKGPATPRLWQRSRRYRAY
jgi:hypothetical protein